MKSISDKFKSKGYYYTIRWILKCHLQNDDYFFVGLIVIKGCHVSVPLVDACLFTEVKDPNYQLSKGKIWYCFGFVCPIRGFCRDYITKWPIINTLVVQIVSEKGKAM